MARTDHRANAATIGTTPFDVGAWIEEEDQKTPGFAAAVEAELASLRLDERLRELRKSRHMTQAQLAHRMGISQSAIAQIERAEPGRMEVLTLAKIATALGYGLTIGFEPQTDARARSARSARVARKR